MENGRGVLAAEFICRLGNWLYSVIARSIGASMRLLLVEDSTRLQRSISKGMRAAGFAVDVTGTGTEGLRMACGNAYDAMILDLLLPGIDGLTVLRKMRDAGSQTHVLVLTAKDEVADRVRGLRSGADDYLVKPFAFDELLARVQALTRRSHGRKNPIIRLGALEIDLSGRRVSRRGQPIELTAREFALLELLLLSAGRVVDRRAIEEHIYDSLAEPMSNVVDAAVYALRRKLDTDGEPSLIETRRGMGYMLRLLEGDEFI
jgi:DNA-binding response OmpR family regulator